MNPAGWIDQVELPEIDAWADAEAEYERFLGDHDHLDLMLMTDAEFEAWKVEYKRPYFALFEAQIAYYNTIKAVPA